ncbi:MAG: hypothetical protein ACI86H_000854 [bacterium]|jgi:hypothetical protein
MKIDQEELEQKILDEIRKRVLEKDKERQQQHHFDDEKEANFQVLEDMTNVSRNEIEKIEHEVRGTLEEKQKKKLQVHSWFDFITGGLFLILFSFLSFYLLRRGLFVWGVLAGILAFFGFGGVTTGLEGKKEDQTKNILEKKEEHHKSIQDSSIKKKNNSNKKNHK